MILSNVIVYFSVINGFYTYPNVPNDLACLACLNLEINHAFRLLETLELSNDPYSRISSGILRHENAQCTVVYSFRVANIYF